MKKIGILFLLICLQYVTPAQNKVSFDGLTFTEPANWTFVDNGSYHTYTSINQAANVFCIIAVYSSDIASGNGNDDFSKAWKDLVAGHFTGSIEPVPQLKNTTGGLQFRTGTSPVSTAQGNLFVQLLVMALPGKTQSILLIAANQQGLDQYKTSISSFLDSLQINKAASNSNTINNNTVANTAGKNIITIATTNFDDGWSATPKDDYVLLTRDVYRVHLYYNEKFNNESRDHTVDYYYTHQLTKEYTITNTIVRNDNYHYYLEGDATENATGKKCYLAMHVVADNGIAKTVVAISPTQAQHKQLFGDDLKNMLGHNRFGVALQDMAGTWKAGSGSSISYYNYTTGDYAGSNAVVMSDKFIFNSTGSFEAEFKGATGMVGNMKTYQQHFTGRVTVISPWQISTTDQDNKTVVYDCWFEAVKGGVVFHLVNHQYTGSGFDLVKEN